jgi:hypothetical protein
MSALDQSPRMVAQRQQIARLFGTGGAQGGGSRPSSAAPGPVTVAQRRAPGSGDVPGGTESGKTSIFDSRVSYGKLLTQTINVVNHDAKTVLAAYQKAIAPIGNSLRQHRDTGAPANYTDVGAAKFPNLVGAMPMLPPAAGIVPYLMANPAGPAGAMQNWLDVPNQSAMEKLFEGLDWNQSKAQIQTWFSTRDLLLDNKYVGLIDPLIVRLSFQSQVRGQRDWVIDTQFGDSATGYIVRVNDGKNDITGSIVTAGAFAVDQANVTTDENDLLYSSTHVPGNPASMGDRIDALTAHQNGDTKGSQHDALDAFTVLGAEGARFIPVAELGGAATLGANFYTKPKSSGFKGAHSVTLQWLYINWGQHFGRAYNITRETMAAVVDAQGLVIASKPAKPNYNLSSGTMDR